MPTKLSKDQTTVFTLSIGTPKRLSILVINCKGPFYYRLVCLNVAG